MKKAKKVQAEENPFSNVIYYESPDLKVSNFIKSKGYIIADAHGVPVNKPDDEGIGILELTGYHRALPLFFVKKRNKALNIGTLFFREKGAIINKEWILEVYGSDNIQKMRILAEQIQSECNIHINVKSEQEEVRYESEPVGEAGACFVATAVYTDQNCLEVKVLRDFRDNVLMNNPLGRAFVDFYYSGAGKKTAEFIKEKAPCAIPLIKKGLDFLVEKYSSDIYQKRNESKK